MKRDRVAQASSLLIACRQFKVQTKLLPCRMVKSSNKVPTTNCYTRKASTIDSVKPKFTMSCDETHVSNVL